MKTMRKHFDRIFFYDTSALLGGAPINENSYINYNHSVVNKVDSVNNFVINHFYTIFLTF